MSDLGSVIIVSQMFLSIFRSFDLLTSSNRQDLLNRYPNGNSKDESTHVLKHIFPKQFGLSNVLTSGTWVGTNREDEIENLTLRNGRRAPVPKRLQDSVITLAAKLQKLQSQCPYHILLRYYCPIFVRLLLIFCAGILFTNIAESIQQCDQGAQERRFKPPLIPKPAAPTGHSSLVAQVGGPASTDILNDLNVTTHTSALPLTKVSSTEHASSVGEVSAFVLSVIKRVIPRALFGGVENQKSIMGSINRFIRLRRFESLSLHDVMQGLKVHTLCFPEGI